MGFGSFLVSAGLYVLLVVAFVSLFVFMMSYRYRTQQNRLLYYPEMPPESREVCEDPVALGIPYAERVCVTTVDQVRLRGFMLWPGPAPCFDKASSAGSSPDPLGRSTSVGSAAPLTVRVEGDSASVGFDGAVPASAAATPAAGAAGSGGINPASSTSFASYTASGTMPIFVLLYFHGNAGNVGHRLPLAQAFVAHLKCAVMMIDYRGFGLSDDAEPAQETMELDAQACFDHLWRDARVPRDRIIIMGTSLGGAVSVHLASHERYARRIAAVIVENTFTSIGDMASALSRPILTRLVRQFPGLAILLFEYYLKPLALRIEWNSAKRVPRIVVPMLFLSGAQDELVPPEQMRALYKAATKCLRDGNNSELTVPLRRFQVFEDGQHNNMPLMPGYMAAIQDFVTDVRSAGAATVL